MRSPERPARLHGAVAAALAALALSACTSASGERLFATPAPVRGMAAALAPQSAAPERAVIAADPQAYEVSQLYAPRPEPVMIQGEPVVTASLPAGQSYDASYPADPYGDPYAAGPVYVSDADPLEPLNRHVFAFNDALDTIALEPLARTYRHLFAPPVRTAVRNFAANLESPVTLANDVMQGEFDRAHVTFTRFAINSTLGVAGFHDAASEMGYLRHREDFDQTLALYGWSSGPYLVVPILGPATPRHVAGRVVDSFFHPLTWALAGQPLPVTLGERAAEGIVAREEVLDALSATKSTATDYYVAIRSLYRQNRTNEITNGQMVAGDGLGAGYDLSEDFDFGH